MKAQKFDLLEKLMFNCDLASFKYRQFDKSLDILVPTEIAFVDYLHSFDGTSSLLSLASSLASKYIVFHDTTVYGCNDERGTANSGPKSGVWNAIDDFLQKNSNWIVQIRASNNYGLTILRKIQ